MYDYWDLRCSHCGGQNIGYVRRGKHNEGLMCRCNDCGGLDPYNPRIETIYLIAATLRSQRPEMAGMPVTITRPSPMEVGDWREILLEAILPDGAAAPYHRQGIYTLEDYVRRVLRGEVRVPMRYHKLIVRAIMEGQRGGATSNGQKTTATPRRNHRVRRRTGKAGGKSRLDASRNRRQAVAG